MDCKHKARELRRAQNAVDVSYNTQSGGKRNHSVLTALDPARSSPYISFSLGNQEARVRAGSGRLARKMMRCKSSDNSAQEARSSSKLRQE